MAAALAVQASAPIVLHSPLTLKVPHAYMSPARQLSCTTVLLSQPHITFERCVTFNPATLLLTAEDGNPHDCVAKTDKNYGSQSWPTRYAFSRSWFNYCLLMVQANKPWTHSHYFHTIPHKQQNWFPWLRTHTHAKDPVSLGNQKADKATNQVALQQPSDTYTIEELDLTILKDMLQYWAMVKTCLNKWG